MQSAIPPRHSSCADDDQLDWAVSATDLLVWTPDKPRARRDRIANWQVPGIQFPRSHPRPDQGLLARSRKMHCQSLSKTVFRNTFEARSVNKICRACFRNAATVSCVEKALQQSPPHFQSTHLALWEAGIMTLTYCLPLFLCRFILKSRLPNPPYGSTFNYNWGKSVLLTSDDCSQSQTATASWLACRGQQLFCPPELSPESTQSESQDQLDLWEQQGWLCLHTWWAVACHGESPDQGPGLKKTTKLSKHLMDKNRGFWKKNNLSKFFACFTAAWSLLNSKIPVTSKNMASLLGVSSKYPLFTM